MHVTCWKTTYRTIAKVTPFHVCSVWQNCGAWSRSPALPARRNVSSLHRAMHNWIAFRRGGLGGRSWLLWLYALLTLNGGIKPTITVYISYICIWRKLIANSCVKVSWWKSNLAHASQGLGDFHAFKAAQTKSSKICAPWGQVLCPP